MTTGLELILNYVKQKNLDAVLINSSEHLISPNLKYVTGFTGTEGAALISASERHFVTDGRYKLQASQQVVGYKIHTTRDKVAAIARILRARRLSRIAIEPARITHELVVKLKHKVPTLTVHYMDQRFLNRFRIRKAPAEVQLLKNAAEIASNACRSVVTENLIGKSELEIAGKLELLFRALGADGPAFPTIVASGPRGALPHAVPTTKKIQPGDLLILDYGCSLGGYNSDETVTCIAGRQPTSLQKKMHATVREAQLRAVEALRVGVKAQAVDNIARKCIADAGFGKHFVHALGHGVGLEVHEPPWLTPRGRELLEEGMIMTIEPGIYIEGVGGVRLESLVLMKADGPIVLSQMTKDLILVN